MDVWLPGAHREPGFNAGYTNGHNRMERAVAHFTVGRDSREEGKRGYYNFLVHRDASRENGCTQYAEIDAVTWHAGDVGNPYGPGIEFERMTTGGYGPEGLANAEPLTDNQLAWGRRIIEFCTINASLYHGPRFDHHDWHGWINHYDLDKDRFDGLTRAEWDAMTKQGDDDVLQVYKVGDAGNGLDAGSLFIVPDSHDRLLRVTQAEVDAIGGNVLVTVQPSAAIRGMSNTLERK